jgi:hypothetical protein
MKRAPASISKEYGTPGHSELEIKRAWNWSGASIYRFSAGYRQLKITMQYCTYLNADDLEHAIRVTMLLQHFTNDCDLAMQTEVSMRVEQNKLKTN